MEELVTEKTPPSTPHRARVGVDSPIQTAPPTPHRQQRQAAQKDLLKSVKSAMRIGDNETVTAVQDAAGRAVRMMSHFEQLRDNPPQSEEELRIRQQSNEVIRTMNEWRRQGDLTQEQQSTLRIIDDFATQSKAAPPQEIDMKIQRMLNDNLLESDECNAIYQTALSASPRHDAHSKVHPKTPSNFTGQAVPPHTGLATLSSPALSKEEYIQQFLGNVLKRGQQQDRNPLRASRSSAGLAKITLDLTDTLKRETLSDLAMNFLNLIDSDEDIQLDAGLAERLTRFLFEKVCDGKRVRDLLNKIHDEVETYQNLGPDSDRSGILLDVANDQNIPESFRSTAMADRNLRIFSSTNKLTDLKAVTETWKTMLLAHMKQRHTEKTQDPDGLVRARYTALLEGIRDHVGLEERGRGKGRPDSIFRAYLMKVHGLGDTADIERNYRVTTCLARVFGSGMAVLVTGVAGAVKISEAYRPVPPATLVKIFQLLDRDDFYGLGNALRDLCRLLEHFVLNHCTMSYKGKLGYEKIMLPKSDQVMPLLQQFSTAILNKQDKPISGEITFPKSHCHFDDDPLLEDPAADIVVIKFKNMNNDTDVNDSEVGQDSPIKIVRPGQRSTGTRREGDGEGVTIGGEEDEGDVGERTRVESPEHDGSGDGGEGGDDKMDISDE